MYRVSEHSNILGLTTLDKMSDGVGVKLAAMIPIVANVVILVKQVRLYQVIENKKFSRIYKEKVLANMVNFTNTNAKWGQIQVIGFLVLGILALLASSLVAPSAMAIIVITCIFAGAVLKLHLLSLSYQVGNENCKMAESYKKFYDKV